MDNTSTPVQPAAPAAAPSSTAHTSSSTPPHALLYGLLILVIVLLGAATGYLFMTRGANGLPLVANNSSESVSSRTIKGSLNINGLIPEGATFDIVATDVSTGQAVKFVTASTAFDNDDWQYDDAQPGSSYSVQAILNQNGQEVAKTSPVTVSAPATEVELTMNIAGNDNTPSQNATITGGIVVNGYIPAGSTITVQGRVQGAKTFSTVASKLPGQARQTMTYSTAEAGTTYEVQGMLIASNGNTIGTSGVLVVTAPAANETLTINSSAQMAAASPQPTSAPASASPTAAPTSNAVISGNITLNGIVPSNSRIVILQKTYNGSGYSVAVDNISPVNGTTWTWRQPAQSTWYDLVAVLKQRQSDGSDKDLSTSSMASVAAPATNVNFTLNSSFSLNPPTNDIALGCGTQQNGVFNANVTFPAQANAQSYWYQIGTSNGGNELTSAAVNANGNNPVNIIVALKPGTTYYARYAYGIQAGLAMGSSQYSPFSVTQQLQCN